MPDFMCSACGATYAKTNDADKIKLRSELEWRKRKIQRIQNSVGLAALFEGTSDLKVTHDCFGGGGRGCKGTVWFYEDAKDPSNVTDADRSMFAAMQPSGLVKEIANFFAPPAKAANAPHPWP